MIRDKSFSVAHQKVVQQPWSERFLKDRRGAVLQVVAIYRDAYALEFLGLLQVAYNSRVEAD
jgi:hypothetical protein